jgi:4-amino-4-deoxy-L-arabinose transferase-like glycosyltransferase
MRFSSTNWPRTKNLTGFFLILIFLIAAFLRLWGVWRLDFFTYDQARDALFIKRIIVDHKLRLIGTQTSIPGVYTPPLYYYLMIPALAVFRLNPVGLDFATAVLNLLGIFVLYLCLLRLTMSEPISLIFSALYAFQPIIVRQSRFAWNPNMMPFFTLLTIWALIEIFNNKANLFAYLVLFFSLGMNINLHYGGIVFALAVLISLILIGWRSLSLKGLFWGGMILFLEVMPVLLFDIRHGFIILKNIIRYLKFGTGGKIPSPPFLAGVWEKFIFLEGLALTPQNINLLLCPLLFAFLFFFLARRGEIRQFKAVILTFFLSLIFSSIYRGSFFPFYLTPFYPLPFLLAGKIVSFFPKKKLIGRVILVLILILVAQNLMSCLKQLQIRGKNNQVRLMNIARFLSSKVWKNFNLASVYSSPERYDRNAVDYRYFLETFFKKKSFDWDPEDYQKAEHLYLVSQIKTIDPLKINLWEVQTFKPRKIEERWETEDVIIYHLVK